MFFPFLLSTIKLRYQYLTFIYPSFCPRFVSPTNTKRYINFWICKHLLHRFFQKQFSSKPIMIITKSINAIFFSNVGFSYTPFLAPFPLFLLIRKAHIEPSNLYKTVWLSSMPDNLSHCGYHFSHSDIHFSDRH